MSKWRKKPVVVEAFQWDGESRLDLPGLRAGVEDYRCEQCTNLMSEHQRVKTLEGAHIACPGDWIITGIKGERYPCKPHIFHATYEKVED